MLTGKPRLFILALVSLYLHACAAPAPLSQPAPAALSSSTQLPQPLPSLTHTAPPTITPTATVTQTPVPSPTFTETVTPTLPPTATDTPLPTITPTYAILRGVVTAEKVSCRYGPGAMYLYLYGLNQGAVQDIIGRTDSGKWILTRSRGDDKSCWVKAEFMDIQGDIMSVEMVYPDKFTLIYSNQGYRVPWNVVAIRQGDQVVISWDSEDRRPGDEESATSVLYVVETWVCQGGQLWFTPIGSFVRQVTVTDEPGCAEPSHGRVYFVEKHGYTGPTDIIWPPAK